MLPLEGSGGDERVASTRRQSDIRGLVTAGRTVRLEWFAGLEIERDPNSKLRIAHRAFAGHSQALPSPPGSSSGHLGVTRTLPVGLGVGDTRVVEGRSAIQAGGAGGWEVSTRSAASMNVVDADEPRHILGGAEGPLR